MFEFNRGNYAQKTNEILEATRGLSSTNTEGTHLIECLRSQLKDVTEEMERLRKELADAYSKSAQVIADLSANLCTASALERERLTAERDEARREVCAFVSGRYSKDVVTLDRAAALDEAKMRGWDCYKEEK